MAPGIDLSIRLPQDIPSALFSTSDKEPSISEVALSSSPTTPTQAANGITLVLEPSTVTTEFDLLRFHAAAFDQLPRELYLDPDTPKASSKDSPPYSTHLISSPYNVPAHYLDLRRLTLSSLLFAKALTALRPTRADYATAPYTSSLNFTTVLAVLQQLSNSVPGFTWPETSFYVVTFRSQLKPGIDNDWLYKLDFESHREACESGGLLKYWFGKANEDRRNLATCFWHSREDAYNGGLGPWHRKARAAGRELYESIVFSTHRFTVLKGAEQFQFEEWSEK